MSNDWEKATPPLHLTIVNQQIFIMKNVIWTILVSTYLSMIFCYIKFKDYNLKAPKSWAVIGSSDWL